jgi:hypothetical protein
MLQLPRLPGALRALADYHDNQSSMAEAQDYIECAKNHEDRAKALTAEAERIEKEWERG